jgi:hypothetical protein
VLCVLVNVVFACKDPDRADMVVYHMFPKLQIADQLDFFYYCDI